MNVFENKKTAVITGATGGIGSELAATIVNEGATVYLLGRHFKELKTLEVIKRGQRDGRVHFCQVDFNNENEIIDTIQQINLEDKIDYLIHGAAFYNYTSFQQSDLSELDRAYRINLRAPYLLTLHLIPKVVSCRGTIVFLNTSVITGQGSENLVQYASTKAALKTMADSIRRESSKDGIRVLTIFLGKTATPMQEKACELQGLPYKPECMIQSEDAAKLIYQAILTPESAEITELYIRPSVSYMNCIEAT